MASEMEFDKKIKETISIIFVISQGQITKQ